MKKVATTTDDVEGSSAAARQIDARIEGLGDWRGKVLARIRALVKHALPDVVEEWKWDVPVWSLDGILFTGEVYKAAVKMTFPHGAALQDPSGLFNSSLVGKTRRAIDVRESDKLDEAALKTLFREAAAWNRSKPKAARATRKQGGA